MAKQFDGPKPSHGGERDADGKWHWDRPRNTPDGTVVRVDEPGCPLDGRVGVVGAWVSRAGVFEVVFRVWPDGSPCVVHVTTPQQRAKLREQGVRVVGWSSKRRHLLQRYTGPPLPAPST